MKTVYKYPLGMGQNCISLPINSKILHVEMQDGFPHLWAEVSGIADNYEPRYLEIFGTGHSIPDDAQYICTFMDSPYVWHVYEIAPS